MSGNLSRKRVGRIDNGIEAFSGEIGDEAINTALELWHRAGQPEVWRDRIGAAASSDSEMLAAYTEWMQPREPSAEERRSEWRSFSAAVERVFGGESGSGTGLAGAEVTR